jgi:hypothetical protein
MAVLLAVGWTTVTMVRAAEGDKVSAPATAVKDSVTPLAPAGTIILAAAKVPLNPPVKPVAPVSAASKTSDVTPPAPMPDFEIPPIPEVGKDAFKAGPTPARTAPADVIEEGKRLFNREGRLEMDPLGRSMFAFNSGDKPMYLLENSWREYLESVTEQATKKARWRVSGVITVYGGRNYLLVTKVVHVLPEEENR